MNLKEQALEGVAIVEKLFEGGMPAVPEGATIESLWAEICRIRGKVKKPKKVEAIRLLLEDDRLTGLNPALVADIVQRVFKRHGIVCRTTESSIRWYISQKTLDWNIKPRIKTMNNTGI